MLKKLADLGKPVVFTHAERLPLLRQYMKIKLGAQYQELFRLLEDNDLALEWCENRALGVALPDHDPARMAGYEQYELFDNFNREEIAIIAAFLRRNHYRRGDVIINAGDEAREMFFLARGGVSVFVPLESGGRKRLATFSAGMVFGEMAVIDHAPRSAMVVADSEVVCDTLNVEDLERLGTTHPEIKIKLLEGLNLCLCRRLRVANRKLSVFD